MAVSNKLIRYKQKLPCSYKTNAYLKKLKHFVLRNVQKFKISKINKNNNKKINAHFYKDFDERHPVYRKESIKATSESKIQKMGSKLRTGQNLTENQRCGRDSSLLFHW